MSVKAQHLEGERYRSFRVEPSETLIYRIGMRIARALVRFWWRPDVTGLENVPADGPVILAPVHRSFLDFSFSTMLTERKIFFMAKDELWRSRVLGRFVATYGAFPVNRSGVDRESMNIAQQVLQQGQLLVIFPEGTRQRGPRVEELHDGVAFLAARAGAKIVPVGIGGSDLSMPKGSKVPKRIPITLVAGSPLDPPPPTQRGRVSRSELRKTSQDLRAAIQRVYDQARQRY